MKKQILPDGTIVLEGSPQELRLLETEADSDGYSDEEDLFDHLFPVEGNPNVRSFAMGPRRPNSRVWHDDRFGHEVHYGGTHRNPRTAEAQRQEVDYLKGEIDRHHETERALRQEAHNVAAKWQAEEVKVAKLERQLAKAVKQGFDPDKKSEYKTEIVTDKGTTIYFKVLKAGDYEGKVAQHYKGGSYLHNGEICSEYYLENYATAGVDPDDRIPYGWSGSPVLAPSEVAQITEQKEKAVY